MSEETTVTTEPTEEISTSAEIVSYDSLSESDQAAFRDRISSSQKITGLESVSEGAYVKLDNRYYEVITVSSSNYDAVIINTVLCIALGVTSILASMLVLNLAHELKWSQIQYITVSIVLLILLASVIGILFPTQPIDRNIVHSTPTPASEIPDDAVIAEASQYSPEEYEQLTDAFAGEQNLYEETDNFISDEVSYIKSDGEYYAMTHKYAPSNWDTDRYRFLLILYLVFGFVITVNFANAEELWDSNGIADLHEIDDSGSTDCEE